MQLMTSKGALEKLLSYLLEICRIEPETKKTNALYAKIGFREGKIDEDSMYRHL